MWMIARSAPSNIQVAVSRRQRRRRVLAHQAEQLAVELRRLVEPVGDDVDVIERFDVHGYAVILSIRAGAFRLHP